MYSLNIKSSKAVVGTQYLHITLFNNLPLSDFSSDINRLAIGWTSMNACMNLFLACLLSSLRYIRCNSSFTCCGTRAEHIILHVHSISKTRDKSTLNSNVTVLRSRRLACYYLLSTYPAAFRFFWTSSWRRRVRDDPFQ